MEARLALLEEQLRILSAQMQQLIELQTRNRRPVTEEDTAEAQLDEAMAKAAAPAQTRTTSQSNTMEEYIHMAKEPANIYAQEMEAEGIPYLRFSKMNLSRFPERRKSLYSVLREAERCRDETYKEWTMKPKTLRLDCMLVRNWPFSDMVLAVVMDTLYYHMVGKAVAKYRIEGTEEWDTDRLKSIEFTDIMKAINIWMEDNPLLDQQFQAKLPIWKSEPAAETKSQSMKFKRGKKFYCPEHGWNKTHGREDCFKLKATATPSAPATEKQRKKKKKASPFSGPSMVKCFLCRNKGHRQVECPMQEEI